MNEFPLASFFTELAIDNGIPVTVEDYERLARVLKTRDKWNLTQLRGVLLALLTHSPDEVEIFKLRFDKFFVESLSESRTFSQEKIQKFIDDLRVSVEEFKQSEAIQDETTQPPDSPDNPLKDPTETGGSKKPETENPAETKKSKLAEPLYDDQFWIGLSGMVVFMIIFWVALYSQRCSSGSTTTPATPTLTPPPTATLTPGPTRTITPSPTRISSVSPTTKPSEIVLPIPTPTFIMQPDPNREWLYYVIFSIIFGIPALTILSVKYISPLLVKLLKYIDFSEHQTDDKASYEYDSLKPQIFRLSKIGGKPSPFLNAAILDDLSRSLDYISGKKFSKRLDLKKSVQASSQNAGMFVLHFRKRKDLFAVYILVDGYAEPRVWNSSAEELYEGLFQRGINVRYGKFYSSLESFQMTDGAVLGFEELKEVKDDALFLFFSDGKRLNPRRDASILDLLAAWSNVVWMDLREARFWDESADLIKRFKIPLYQAGSEGITQAIQYFAKQVSDEKKASDLIENSSGEQSGWANKNPSLNKSVKKLIGEESLPWVQACSMIQPVSLGMADALRRKFSPQVLPEQVERLFRLPKTSWNVSGIYFSTPILSVLHGGFKKSWSNEEQEQILSFILSEIKKSEPREKDSLEYIMWRWFFEKVNLELIPDEALNVFEKLVKTPLGERIKSDFAKLSLPGKTIFESENDDDGISTVELRLRPKTYGLVQFSKLADKEINFDKLKIKESFSLLWYKISSSVKSFSFKNINFKSLILESLNNLTNLWRADAGQNPVSSEHEIPERYVFSVSSLKSKVLEVRNLHTYINGEDGVVKAVKGISFQIFKGEVLGLVGESGCGKSTVLSSIMRLIPPSGKIMKGEIIFHDKNLLNFSPKQIRKIRGNKIAMIFQDPATALNPFLTVGEQIAEVFRLHQKLNSRQAYAAALESMNEVLIPNPARWAADYPHHLSGGMCQRIMIALALACKPDLLLADEPTSSLDSITQIQIVELLNKLQKDREMAILFVSHDLSLIGEVADRVCVMYMGKIVEQASTKEIFTNPRHPYTQGLLNSIPKMKPANDSKKRYLPTIKGVAPGAVNLPSGCHFAPRCDFCMEECKYGEIPLYNVKNKADVRCVLYK